MNLFLVCAGFLLGGVCVAAQRLEPVDPNADDPWTANPTVNEVTDPCADHECCDDTVATYDLSSGESTAQPAGFKWIRPLTLDNTPYKDKKCAHYGLIKVNFEAVTDLGNPCNVCVSNPWWGRRMLKLDFKFHPSERGDRLFNIGDSVSNDGDAGDYGDQYYDAEIDADYPHLDLWQNDVCREELNTPNLVWRYADSLATGLSTTVDTMTIYIANQMTRVQYAHHDHTLCSKCMFGLNNYPDTGVNNDIYISFNSVVRQSRFGYGLCRVEASWVCPQVFLQ